MTESWGPWIEHDGKGCPCVGMWVESEERCGLVEQHVASGEATQSGNCWEWESLPPFWQNAAIIRYRIRRPRALLQLIEMVENLPAPERVQA